MTKALPWHIAPSGPYHHTNPDGVWVAHVILGTTADYSGGLVIGEVGNRDGGRVTPQPLPATTALTVAATPGSRGMAAARLPHLLFWRMIIKGLSRVGSLSYPIIDPPTPHTEDYP